MAQKGEVEGDSLLAHSAPPGRDSARVQNPDVHYDDDDNDDDHHQYHARDFNHMPPEPEPPQYSDGPSTTTQRRLQPFDGIIAPKTGWKDHNQKRLRLIICYGVLILLIAVVIVAVVVGVIFGRRAGQKPDPSQIANQTNLVVIGDGSPDQPTALFFRSSDTLLQVTMDGDVDSPISITASSVDKTPLAGAAYYGYHENDDPQDHPDAQPPYIGYYFAYLGFDSGVNFHPRLKIQFSMDKSGANFKEDTDIHSNATFITDGGLSAAPGIQWNETSKQWDGGISIFGCLDDGSLHEFAYRGKGNLTDLYAFDTLDGCSRATVLRHDAAAYLIRRPNPTAEDLAVWTYNAAWKPSPATPTSNGTATNATKPTDGPQRWDESNKSAFKVPVGSNYCASGEMFAYQDQDGALHYVPLTFQNNGIAWGPPTQIPTPEGALPGTALACRWTKDHLRVYYQSASTQLFQVDKDAAAGDWNGVQVEVDIE